MEEHVPVTPQLVPRLEFPASALARLAPEVIEDHLLRVSVRDEDIELLLTYPVRPPSEPGDVIRLLVRGVPVGDAVDLTRFDLGDQIPLTLKAADRPYTTTVDRLVVAINYRVTYSNHLSEDGPPDQQFVTDIVSPGGGSLAALEFSAEVREKGVIPETLTTDPTTGERYLAAIVKGYGTQSSGDRITGWINQILPTEPVELTEGHVGNDVEIRFDEVRLKAVDGGIRAFSYRVEDRAGNVSIFGSHVDLPVDIEPRPIVLEPARVPGADDGLITTEDADVDGGVLVEIPGNDAIAAADVIWVTWNDHRYGPFDVDAGQVGKDPILDSAAPYDDVYDDWYAVAGDTDTNVEARVIYEVWRNGRLWGRPDAPTNVLVNLFGPGGKDPDPGDPWHGALGAPSVFAHEGAGPENLIPADALDEDALATIPGMTVTVPAVPAFRRGDRIQLYWVDTPVGDPVEVTAAGIDVDIVVSSSVLKTHSPGVWDVWYEARRPLNTPPFENTARSPARPVDVKDVRDLPGGGKPLRAAKWLAGVGEVPEQIDYLEMIRDKGTNLRLYVYENAAIGDILDITFQGYQTRVPGREPIDETRHDVTHMIVAEDLLEKDDDSVTPPEKARFVNIHIPLEKMIPIEFGSATFDYDASNDAGRTLAERAWIYVIYRHAKPASVPADESWIERLITRIRQVFSRRG